MIRGAVHMFEFIQGKVEFVTAEYIVIENQGIGYQLATPNPYVYSKLIGEKVKIYTYFYMRQDVVALYGFQSREEKLLFTKLLSVSGIGPKSALAILASGEPKQIVMAIENENEAFLKKFPGIGKKTARQMILDLKGKLHEVIPDRYFNLFDEDDIEDSFSSNHQPFEEAILALKALGYTDKEINRIKPELKKEQLTTDEYIKAALKKLLK